MKITEMAYIRWEYELKGLLTSVSRVERDGILSYYRELYGDKCEAGLSTEEILAEFGTPKECAAKLTQDTDAVPSHENDGKKENVAVRAAAYWIGIFFLAVFVLIPLAAVLLSVIASFFAAGVSGVASTLVGAAVLIWSLVELIRGVGAAVVFANFGVALAAVGLGILLTALFYVLTKYLIIACYKIYRFIVISLWKKGEKK